ncbi:hypothetical protein ACWEWQ_41255, partial [Streptomyces sp. NPDC003832]
MNTVIRTDRGTTGKSGGRSPYAVAAVAVAALLTATACRPGTDDGADPAPSDRPGATAAAPTATGAAKPGTTASEGTEGAESTGGKGGGTAAACAAEDLTFGTTLQDAEDEVPKHLLITVTNVGADKCSVHHYPHIFLGDYADARHPMDVYDD